MKAIFVDEPLHIRIAEVERPSIGEKEVLIRIISAGICGSDVGIYYGTNSLVTYPRLIGHEYGGEVVEVGSAVKSLKAGDLVSVDPVRACGHCYACTHGRHNVCSTLEVTGVHRDGGFAEYVAAEEQYCYPLEMPDFPKEYLCLVEPYSIGVQVNHRGRVSKEDHVLIMGSGPIGLCIMQAAKYRGAKVTMTDLVDSRLERAKDMGADEVFNAGTDGYLDQALATTQDGQGFTVVIDTICSTWSFPLALDMACPAGRVVTLGLINKSSEVAQVSITKKELDVIGSRLSNSRFPEVLECFKNGAFTPQKLCTHRISYRDVEKAICEIKEHPENVCKIIICFDN